MKNVEGLLPLIDIVFLTLGTLLVCMTRMDMVKSVDVNFVRLGAAQIATVQLEEPVFVAVRPGQLFVDEQEVDPGQAKALVSGRQVVVRAYQSVPYGEVLRLVGNLKDAAANITLEVKSEE